MLLQGHIIKSIYLQVIEIWPRPCNPYNTQMTHKIPNLVMKIGIWGKYIGLARVGIWPYHQFDEEGGFEISLGRSHICDFIGPEAGLFLSGEGQLSGMGFTYNRSAVSRSLGQADSRRRPSRIRPLFQGAVLRLFSGIDIRHIWGVPGRGQDHSTCSGGVNLLGNIPFRR